MLGRKHRKSARHRFQRDVAKSLGDRRVEQHVHRRDRAAEILAALIAGEDRVGQALLERGVSAERPVVVLSGNDIEHALLHLHGALFSAWTLLLLSQTWLAANDRLEHHRAWGLVGISLATALLFVAILVVALALRGPIEDAFDSTTVQRTPRRPSARPTGARATCRTSGASSRRACSASKRERTSNQSSTCDS